MPIGFYICAVLAVSMVKTSDGTMIVAKYMGVGSNRQNARMKAGAKKFVRSRVRAREKGLTEKLRKAQ